MNKREVISTLGRKCLKCGSKERLTVDHILPIIYGGTNDLSNLQVLCRSCNCAKGAKMIDYRCSPPVQTDLAAIPKIERQIIPTTVSLPGDVHAALVEMAESADRSLNGQIVNCLRACITAQKAEARPTTYPLGGIPGQVMREKPTDEPPTG